MPPMTKPTVETGRSVLYESMSSWNEAGHVLALLSQGGSVNPACLLAATEPVITPTATPAPPFPRLTRPSVCCVLPFGSGGGGGLPSVEPVVSLPAAAPSLAGGATSLFGEPLSVRTTRSVPPSVTEKRSNASPVGA